MSSKTIQGVLLLFLVLSLSNTNLCVDEFPPSASDSDKGIQTTKIDYSGIKGDFKTLCLGDSQELINDKVLVLWHGNEITRCIDCSYPPVETFYANIFDQEMYVSLKFYNNQLYTITLTGKDYSADAIDYSLKDFILKTLKSSFVTLYGPPTQDYGYPSVLTLREGYVTYAAKWVLKNKTIFIGVSQYEYEFSPYISIEDNALSAAKKKDDDAKQKQSQAASIKNF